MYSAHVPHISLLWLSVSMGKVSTRYLNSLIPAATIGGLSRVLLSLL